MVELNDQIIPREDPEISASLKDALEGRRHDISPRRQNHQSGENRRQYGDQITIENKDGSIETLTGSHLLVCIGQVPNADDLGLDKAGIETDQAGFIQA